MQLSDSYQNGKDFPWTFRFSLVVSHLHCFLFQTNLFFRSFNPSPSRGGNQVGPCEKWYHGVVNPVKAGDRIKVFACSCQVKYLSPSGACETSATSLCAPH